MGSLLSYNINGNSGFVVASGAILGCCAALLWTSQGSLTLAYASEGSKGRYFGIFWVLFNLGGVLGAAVELGISWDSTTNSVSNSVYIALLCIAACGTFLPALLVSRTCSEMQEGRAAHSSSRTHRQIRQRSSAQTELASCRPCTRLGAKKSRACGT